jgi:hypothetical protein
MYPRIILIAVAVCMLIPRLLSAQEVDPSVQAIDPSVNSRVQDPDSPDNALLPGGSSAWTGQPIMSQTPTTGASGTSGSPQKTGSASRPSQFPSLVGVSAWGQSSFGSSSSQNASGAQDSLSLTGARTRPQLASRWSRNAFSRKSNVTAASADPQSSRSGRAGDELSVEENRPSNSNLKLRGLKRATQRSTRSRITNPFQAKADAATAAHWGSDQSSTYALTQQRHESGMLLHYGFNARSDRQAHRKRRKRGAATNSTSR